MNIEHFVASLASVACLVSTREEPVELRYEAGHEVRVVVGQQIPLPVAFLLRVPAVPDRGGGAGGGVVGGEVVGGGGPGIRGPVGNVGNLAQQNQHGNNFQQHTAFTR